MAEFYTDAFKNAYKTDSKDKLVGVFETIPARELTAEVKAFSAKYTVLGTELASEKLYIGRLPKGVKVIGSHTVGLSSFSVGVETLDGATVLPAAIAADVGAGVYTPSNLMFADDWNVFASFGTVAAGDIEIIILYTEM